MMEEKIPAKKRNKKNKKRTACELSNTVIAAIFCLFITVVCISSAPVKAYELYRAIRAGEFTRDFSASFESNVNSSFPQKNMFIDLNGLVHKTLLQREMNGIVLLKNGHEHGAMEDRDNEGIAANADSLKQFSDWLEEKGVSFFWCQVPQKVNDSDNLLPAGVVDYSNRVADEFLADLVERDVKYLDLRECIASDGIDRHSLFLKTEHHWSPEGGFYAFQKICDYLREEFGEKIPEYVTDIDNYEKETYKNGSLGYYGQRTGWVFGGFDDFTLIYPSWETSQSSWAPHKELLREGTFYDAIFYTDYLNLNWRNRGLYGTYIGGDWPLVVHHSETAPVDKTVMILIDSFGTIPEAFLTTVYQNVVALDLRWVLRTGMEKSTVEFVEEYDPDIVIVMLNPNQIGSIESEQFQFGIK